MNSIDPDAARLASQAVPSIPHGAEGPVFREPWEAQAFAMALALHDRGLFTWSEWAATLGSEIKRAQAGGDSDTGETYYHHWLATLERLVAEKGITNAQTLTRSHAIVTLGTAPPTARRTACRLSSDLTISEANVPSRYLQKYPIESMILSAVLWHTNGLGLSLWMTR